ncbi:nucleotidyltransferase family protein [Cytobacillus sp. Sa5YUA1]|uniref:Nucleotidyltransferase family protein n=1 Tax=Cytobacillus stercorigallinarum TaxID=2762240 RepID=A0ABR8QQH3_9BACI|nr:nucleotidyltransferase family protein [Cytobacillus stercorigallinarum]MBD7937789.1 nucleotidyltransferase family protein [Cytobacillus stercorigallinarum]
MRNLSTNHHKRPIKAIILAAGLSTRMGRTKQLLPFKGTTMLQYVIEQVLKLHCKEVIAVIGHDAVTIMEEIKISDPSFSWLINEDYANGQSSSLYKGLSKVVFPEEDALVFLGDTPFIEKKTSEMIIERGQHIAREKNHPFTIRPLYNQTAGHPVYFANISNTMIQSIQQQSGKNFIRTIPYKEEIAVNDRGILLDIDTRQRYEKLVDF